ncbi:hypothetical protein [Nannocystis pusilla]|uniref:hypothetical protein n=1 Tax=Nannocystis pusilla TaxID=889268 RepID=UPI003B812C37
MTVAAVAEALESPEVEAGLDDLFDTISGPIDDDEFESDGPGLSDLRVAFARGKLQEPDDES